MSAKIKTKLQKFSRLQEYFDEVQDKKIKKIKGDVDPPINLTTHNKKANKSEQEKNGQKNEKDIEMKHSSISNEENLDDKDNKIVKLDIETLNDISKNDTNETNPILTNSSTTIPF